MQVLVVSMQQELAGMREEEEQRTAEKVAAVEATAQKERAAKQAAEASLQQATADLCEKTRYAHDLDEKVRALLHIVSVLCDRMPV